MVWVRIGYFHIATLRVSDPTLRPNRLRKLLIFLIHLFISHLINYIFNLIYEKYYLNRFNSRYHKLEEFYKLGHFRIYGSKTNTFSIMKYAIIRIMNSEFI